MQASYLACRLSIQELQRLSRRYVDVAMSSIVLKHLSAWARTRRPPCMSGRPGRMSTARSPRHAGCPCQLAHPETSTKDSLASDLQQVGHQSLTLSSALVDGQQRSILTWVPCCRCSMALHRTSMQNAPSMAVLYKLQKRARHDGGIPLSEVTPAQQKGRHHGESEQPQRVGKLSSVQGQRRVGRRP